LKRDDVGVDINRIHL